MKTSTIIKYFVHAVSTQSSTTVLFLFTVFLLLHLVSIRFKVYGENATYDNSIQNSFEEFYSVALHNVNQFPTYCVWHIMYPNLSRSVLKYDVLILRLHQHVSPAHDAMWYPGNTFYSPKKMNMFYEKKKSMYVEKYCSVWKSITFWIFTPFNKAGLISRYCYTFQERRVKKQIII